MSKLTQFGHSFQVKVLSVLITDRDFLQQSADIVSPDYFDNDASKWIIKKTLGYYNKYKTIPTMEVFKVEVDKLINEVQGVAVKDLLKQAYKSSKSEDLDFVKNTFLDFCKNQTLKNALMKSRSREFEEISGKILGSFLGPNPFTPSRLSDLSPIRILYIKKL